MPHHITSEPAVLATVPMPAGPALALVHGGRPSVALAADDNLLWVGVRKEWAEPLLALGFGMILGYMASEIVGKRRLT